MSDGDARDLDALIEFVNGRQLAPHAWGSEANDCASFVLQAGEAMTGRRRAAELSWSSRAGALRVIRRFRTLEAAFDHYFQRIPPARAMRGDVAGVADATFGIHPMLVEGETLVGPGDRGLRRMPRRAMIVAWSATLPTSEAAP